MPCGNCTLRAASHLCQYEARSEDKRKNSTSGSNSPQQRSGSTGGDVLPTTDVGSGFGYLRNQGNTAVEVLEKLNLGGGTWGEDGTFDLPEQVELQSYNRIIATIPPRPYVALLVNVFFKECNWIYGCIHEGSFRALLEKWYNMCVQSSSPAVTIGINESGKEGGGTAQSSKPENPSDKAEKRRSASQFPALLLQVLAVSLQMLPKEYHKYMAQIQLGKEDFRNLSTTYSNSACELAALLSATQATLPRVQQWFLRASWLKSEGRAVEAWHSLGQSIREAQELGLHKDQPRAYVSNGVGDVVILWQREIEKRVWVNLYVWDRFMSMILGRPTLINDRHCTMTLPVDCDMPNDLTKCIPIARGPMDAPSTYTERLLDYQLAHLIDEIDDMQTKSAKAISHDFEGVDRLHAKIFNLIESFPASLAVENRDTSYDSSHRFLRAQAELLRCSTFSLIVGLHRPFIFTRNKSRREIVSAGLRVLESQQALIDATREHHHTIYTLNFFTFDPAVLISAIIIKAPMNIHNDMLERAMAHLRSGARRMEILGKRIKLAEKGACVLNMLLMRAELSMAKTQQVRMIRAGATVAAVSSPSEASSGENSDHDQNANNYNQMPPGVADPMGLGLDVGGPADLGVDPGAGYGPIGTGLLSTRELDEILTSVPGGESLIMDPVAVTPGMDMFHFGSGMFDGVESDNFWQNLLNVPFQ
ncbi:fungal-specific transcription factor domain-containing protein [Geopyxis carbonaria]|nr:fungal-specific transcription factor domain-containing protein [Geopyxis carbonaria]